MRSLPPFLVAALGGCGFQIAAGSSETDAGIDAEPPAEWRAGSMYRKKITFTSGTTTLPEFVAAVALPADPDLALHAQDDGSDIVLTGSDGLTTLPFEREQFDGATGELAAWVQIASFTPTSEIYLYYGGVETDRQDPMGTWPMASYAGVWHFTDPLPAAARDSTPNAMDLVAPVANNAPALAAGLVGRARSYDGTDDTLQRTGATAAALTHGTSSFSYAAWVNVAMHVGSYDMVFYKGGSNINDPGYDMELGSGGWASYVCDDAQHIVGGTFGGNNLLDRWVQLVVVVDRATQQFRFFTDGQPGVVMPISAVGSTTNTLPFAIGRTAYPLRALVDEPRVHRSALTPEWIGAEYRNLAPATRDAFRVVGPEEVRP